MGTEMGIYEAGWFTNSLGEFDRIEKTLQTEDTQDCADMIGSKTRSELIPLLESQLGNPDVDKDSRVKLAQLLVQYEIDHGPYQPYQPMPSEPKAPSEPGNAVPDDQKDEKEAEPPAETAAERRTARLASKETAANDNNFYLSAKSRKRPEEALTRTK